MVNLDAVVAAVKAVDGVISARAWTKVPGKERVYIDLSKHNGGARWNGGKGHTVIVYADGKVELDSKVEWAGAATRNWHYDNDTVAKIEQAAAAV